MKDQERIIDCNVLSGFSNYSINKSLDYKNKFSTAIQKEDYINSAINAGYKSFFTNYNLDVINILKKKKGIDVYGIVPDMQRYVRDMNNYGVIMMGLKRIFELGFGLVNLVPVGIKNSLGVLNKDFKNIIVILLEIEMVKLKKLKPKIVFLHPQLTDMFIANGYYEPLKSFEEHLLSKHNVEPGLFTNNVSLVLRKLSYWNSKIKYVCCPVNPRGYLMKPNEKIAIESIMKTDREIIGSDVTCGETLPIDKSESYCKALNIKKYIVEKDSR